MNSPTLFPSMTRWLLAGLGMLAVGVSVGLSRAWGGPLPLVTGEASAFSAMLLGALLGLKHALDADHLAAVSVIVSQRKSLWSSSWVGVLWGLGHSISLIGVALLVVVAHVGVPPALSDGLEALVALMLIGLGLNAARVLHRGGVMHMHAHAHGDRMHVHPHLHAHGPHDGNPGHTHHELPFRVRSVMVGAVHGLAGSATVMLLALAALPTPTSGLVYIGAFAFGSTLGMFLMTLLLGLPIQLAARRLGLAYRALCLGTAVGSVCTGVWLAAGLM